ncbi:MAG: AarF/ABC1/UbiB kinase family protein [Alphaproteobacteria bacterium]|jgi:predicted unusual protein kinase regulating ubiquinone biosynthesis (AarF/ABC1/UbiB family)|nr:AarF/ABC1/UbiB kinase family protein [Alphaproteobacteria bacterium]MCB9985614.1 AarF/ABC1/UbiB kinase family protein [Micavibrio sp.]
MAKKSPDKGNLGQRVKRYSQVSSTMAGVAVKVAGEKFLGVKIEREKHAASVLAVLGNLKGPLMKVGQILATIPEALPPEYAAALQNLQSNAPPMGWPFVKRRMKTELGNDWETKFKTFGHEAAAAASLGQVHKATLHDGREAACKLQYPDMESAIAADLSQLKLIFSLYETYDQSIQTTNIHHELKDRLYEELDYERESRHCGLYNFMLREEKQVHVPQVIPELSTKKLLTATWLDGAQILDFKSASVETRNAIALNMFRAWYVPLYYYGVIHGDPHLGNYSVRQDFSINLLDFGCVRVFPADFIGGVIDLYRALQKDDRPRAVHAFETWGFKNLNHDQIDTLLIWARFLYEPLLDNQSRVIGKTESGVYGRETARKVHQRLREVGGVTPPREFVFMDRAALGLGSVFIHLQAEINWHRMFEDMIEGFNITELEKRQKSALTKFNLFKG